MCIGNLRNALQNVDDYIITHRRGFLENGLLYFGVIFTFVFGAVVLFISRILCTKLRSLFV